MSRHRFLNDIIFKVVFATEKNEPLLRALLNALLELDRADHITELVILNPFLGKEYLPDKGVILDVKARDVQGRQYNVEVQLSHELAYLQRSVYYVTRLYNEQLTSGGGYDTLAKTIGISLVDFILFPDREDLQSTYRLHDVVHAHSLSDILEMHYIEIVKFRKDKPHGLRTPFEKWLHVLKFAELYEKGLEPLPEVLEQEEGIAMALEAMRRAWSTDEVREMIELREKALHDEATRREKAVREGEAKGEARGVVKGLREAAERFLALGMDRETVLRTLDLPPDALP